MKPLNIHARAACGEIHPKKPHDAWWREQPESKGKHKATPDEAWANGFSAPCAVCGVWLTRVTPPYNAPAGSASHWRHLPNREHRSSWR